MDIMHILQLLVTHSSQKQNCLWTLSPWVRTDHTIFQIIGFKVDYWGGGGCKY